MMSEQTIPLDMLDDIREKSLPPLGTGPLSWRDVYSAVADSEKRVLGAIGQLRADIGKVTDDHEVRVRTIEASFVTRPEHEVLLNRVAKNEDKLQSLNDRETGVVGTLKGQRDAIILLVAVATLFFLFVSNTTT